MVCIHCGQKTEIYNSRPQHRTNQVWRRRRCLSCGAAFSTQETIDYTTVCTVQGRDSHLQPFSRDKLFLSLLRSCEHRNTALEDAGALADTIIKKILTQAENGHISAQQIVQIAQVSLNRFDNAASVHYAAFHK